MVSSVSPIGGQQTAPSGMTKLKEWFTSSVFYRDEEITTIDQALEMKKKHGGKPPSKQLNFLQKLVKRIKIGHPLGICLAGFGALGLWLDKLWPDSFLKPFFIGNAPLSIFGGIVSFLTATFGKNTYEESLRTHLDDFVRKFIVDKNGKAVTPSGLEWSEEFPDMSCVVYSEENKSELKDALNIIQSQERGGALCFSGVSHCGKTMTTKALTRDLAGRSLPGKAQWWFATPRLMDKTLSDRGAGIELFGFKIGGETVTERLERVVSNAILEKDPVVIVLDEAHLMLGSDTESFNAHDPAHRSMMTEQISKFISEVIKTKNCKNIYVCFTLNSAPRTIPASITNRVDGDIYVERPEAEERKELIRMNLERELQRMTRKYNFTLTESDYERLAREGDAELLKYFGDGDINEGKDIAEKLGLGAHLYRLKKVSMLQCKQIETAIQRAVSKFDSKSGKKTKNNLIHFVKSELRKFVNKELQRGTHVDEKRYYWGEDRDQSSNKVKIPYRALRRLVGSRN